MVKSKSKLKYSDIVFHKPDKDKMLFNKKLKELVYNYPTKHKEGFLAEEQKDLLSKFPNVNMDKYYDALNGITCMADETGQFIIYHCDILQALICGIENRDMTSFEWD